jgi:VWFA-related protein
MQQRICVSRRGFLASTASFLPGYRLLGADEDAVKFSTDVKVVSVLATVRDKKGAIVKSLLKDDFVLQEDGHPQVIKYFSQQSDLPLTIGLLVDTSGSQRRVLGKERDATQTFIEQVLREKDQTFLIHFDHEVELLQDLTNSKKKLEDGLDKLSAGSDPQLQRQGGGGGGYPSGGGGGYPSGGGGRRGGQGGSGTQLYDAIWLASGDDLMKKQTGRKAVMLLTDGVDHGSKMGLSDAIESAQRANTLVYSILFADKEGYGNQSPFGGMGRHGGMRLPPQGASHPDGKKVLQRIAQETGGGFFEVSDKHPLDKIYSQIEEELRSQYSLGYTSDATSGPGFRKISLTAKKKDLVVQATQGYFAK